MHIIGLHQVAGIFGKVCGSAATVGNITSVFKESGIYPFNPYVFPDDLFLPSKVTDNFIEKTNDRKCEEKNDEELPRSSSSSIAPPYDGSYNSQFNVIAGSSTIREMVNGISPLSKSVTTGRARGKSLALTI